MRGYRNLTLGILYLGLVAWLAYLDAATAAATAGAAGLGVTGVVAGRAANKKYDGAQ